MNDERVCQPVNVIIGNSSLTMHSMRPVSTDFHLWFLNWNKANNISAISQLRLDQAPLGLAVETGTFIMRPDKSDGDITRSNLSDKDKPFHTCVNNRN